MELLSSDLYFILVDGDRSLWVNRKTGTFSAKIHDYDELMRTTEAACLGTVYGFIGKLHYNESTEPRLAFIQKRAKVGEIKGCNIYCIRSIVTIPLETETELLLEPCRKAHGKSNNNNAASSLTTTSGGGKSKAFTSIEPVSAAVTSSVNPASSTALQKVKSSAGGTAKFLNFPSITKRQEKQGVDKIEKRMLDEFHKMFTEADSFYYSDTYDITNTVQRNFRTSEKQKEGNELPLWRLADSRFFWNIHLMNDLITSGDASLDRWILPIIQGFIQQEVADVNQFEMLGDGASGGIDMFVISRRSRFRAGTRYLRRGVDESGKVANYVETEQILVFKGHVISFVQVRGSIPVYWSQPGYKYRPPPRLDRSPDESFLAFTKHFEEEEAIYGPVTIVNLVEKNGKEKVLGDAYLDAVIRYDSPSISYFAFDFHEWCRGMRFENVSLLVEKLEPVLKNMNYTWVDSYGLVLRQEGVCRINCVDCLDRTNVVQTNLSKFMIVLQLSKLGLLIPDVGLPSSVKLRLQTLWANNGDIISKQYAGTNALKGDFTRTGERRLAGMMKDGMNSASRYYLNRFRDASRQAAIDIFLGVRTDITEDELDGEKVMSDEKENTAEQIRQVIDDVKRCIIPAADVTLGAWGFVNAKTNEPDSMDIDTIFVLTASQYYVTEYDCDLDTLTDTQKIALKAIDSIEIGNEPVNQPSNLWSIFHSSNSAAKGIPSVRLYYEQDGQIYYHQFRSSNVRFFNNVIVPVSHNADEMMESLRMFAEAVTAAVSAKGKEIPVNEVLVLAPKESPRGSNRIPAVATSWVHRYFSFGNENDVSDKQMTSSHSSSQNGSPERGIKINRRASSAAQNQPEGCDATAGIIANFGGEIEERKGGAERGDELGNNEMVYSSEEMSEKALCVDEIDLGLSLQIPIDDKKPQLLKHSAQTPIEGYRNLLVPAKDLVLPSCGILSMHENNFTSSLTALLSAHELIVEMDGLPSPVTPPSANIPEDSERSSTLEDDVSRSSPKHSMSPTFNPENYRAALQRHRHSLPVPSLIISKPPVNRPITPEIKITEEPGTVIKDETSQRGKGEESILSPTSSIGSSRSVTGKLHVTIPKRMTRSTDDVNRISSESPSSMMSKLTSAFGGGTPLRFGRIPANTISADNRATSDVDLFGAMVNMKGSHSDNTLRENPYKNPSATASASNKKELVLAPLGKFARGMQSIGANYLDPRKLKGTFNLKGAPKLENIGSFVASPRVEHSREEITALQERIKGCKSLIVDV